MAVMYYTEKDIARLETNAYQRGYTAGRKHGHRYKTKFDNEELDSRITEMLNRITSLEREVFED